MNPFSDIYPDVIDARVPTARRPPVACFDPAEGQQVAFQFVACVHIHTRFNE